LLDGGGKIAGHKRQFSRTENGRPLGGTKEFTEWAIVRLGDRPHGRRAAFGGPLASGWIALRGQAAIAAVIDTGRMLVGVMLASAGAGAMKMGAVEMLAKNAVPARP